MWKCCQIAKVEKGLGRKKKKRRRRNEEPRGWGSSKRTKICSGPSHHSFRLLFHHNKNKTGLKS